VLLVLAPVAVAHSTLVSTKPTRDRVVDHSPKVVALHFDEPVETALGSVTVYDGEGGRVDAGKIMRPSPKSVQVKMPSQLERGTYTVVWRVISADSDPIKGAWVFHVKKPGAQPAGIAAQVLKDTPFVVSVFYLGGRFLDFALLLACVGRSPWQSRFERPPATSAGGCWGCWRSWPACLCAWRWSAWGCRRLPPAAKASATASGGLRSSPWRTLASGTSHSPARDWPQSSASSL
jgi:methionine-rich copper-binding protein CopC